MDRSILWRAAAAQVLLVALISVILALVLPRSFFEDWGWVTGPAAWLACAAITAWALHLPLRGVMLGAVLAGVHWLGVAIAVAAFAGWCARVAGPSGRLRWT